MPTISVIINTCDEAHLLRDCIISAQQVADNILICDMESTDNTAEIAHSFHCQYMTHKRMSAPEPEARIAAINACDGDWIYVLDPDMRISERNAKRVRQIVENDEADMVDFYCNHVYFGYQCRFGHGSQPVYRKLFKRSAFTPRSVNIQTFWHDSLSGRLLRLPRDFAIVHLAYPSVNSCIKTHERYALREAEQAVEHGIKPSIARMLFRPGKRFIGNYFLRQGFRDGVPGLIISIIVSFYLFAIEANIWHINREKTTR